MRKAKVIALAFNAPPKKVYKRGDIVGENNLPKGRFDELIEKGFIKEIEGDETPAVPSDKDLDVEITTGNPPVEEKKEEEKKDEAPDDLKSDEGKSDEEKPLSDEEKAQKEIDDTTRKEIMLELDKRGIEYSKNASKAELYELYRSSKEQV